MKGLALSLLMCLPSSLAGQWAFLSEQDALKGKMVFDVGEISRRSVITPSRFEYDPALQMNRLVPGKTLEWLNFQGSQRVCLDPYSVSGSPRSDAALLLVDKDSNLYLAILEVSIGSVKVDVSSVHTIDCPSPF